MDGETQSFNFSNKPRRRSPDHRRAHRGAIDVFQRRGADHYAAIARVVVGLGAGNTSLHVKNGLYVSWPNKTARKCCSNEQEQKR